MLGLLQRKPKPRGRLDIRRAMQVFDAVPCNVFKPLEVHDFFIHTESLFTSKYRVLHRIGSFFFSNRYFWRKNVIVRVKRLSLEEFYKKCHDVVMWFFFCCPRETGQSS